MTFAMGWLDAPVGVGESEFGGDDSTGWAGDLGVAQGRQPTAGELAAKLRRDGDAELERAYSPASA
jgi:hypothetical protein